MPLRLAFHIRNAFALGRVADKDGGAALRGRCAAQTRKDAAQAVSVDFGHGPFEGAPFGSERFEPHDLVVAVVALQFVVVDEHAKIVELVMRRAHRGFPHFAFLHFAIAEHCVNARFASLHFQAQRHAERDGKSLSQRACARFGPGQIENVRMTLKWAVELAQG